MSWWSRLLSGRRESELKPQRLDYLTEALALERQGDLDAALTSYRLALREKPDDHKVLVNMAIAYTRLGRSEEALRCYRRALEVAPDHAGANYGLGFLLLKRGDRSGARTHIEAFLNSPSKADAANIEHARKALADLASASAGYGVPSESVTEPET
jgi:Flp pilus assembly protein TadD